LAERGTLTRPSGTLSRRERVREETGRLLAVEDQQDHLGEREQAEPEPSLKWS
jgi:hypothetical protein